MHNKLYDRKKLDKNLLTKGEENDKNQVMYSNTRKTEAKYHKCVGRTKISADKTCHLKTQLEDADRI